MQTQQVDALLEPIIKDLLGSEDLTNCSKKQLQQRALAVLLAKVAEQEIDVILEIAAKALKELGWSEIGENLKQQARQIRILYF